MIIGGLPLVWPRTVNADDIPRKNHELNILGKRRVEDQLGRAQAGIEKLLSQLGGKLSNAGENWVLLVKNI